MLIESIHNMKKKKLEKMLVDKIALFLSSNKNSHGSAAGKRIKLWTHKKWKNVHKNEYSLRPDIDILQKQGNGKIGGIEVKVFHSDENKYIFSGIDQALSLLRFGLDNTRLVHVFIIKVNSPNQNEEIEKMTDRFTQYAFSVSDFIKAFKLPVGYTPFSILLQNEGLVTSSMNVLDVKDKNKSLIIHPPTCKLDWGNIPKHYEYRKKIRNYLVKNYLKNSL